MTPINNSQTARIHPLREKVDFRVNVPGSKSEANRMLLMAAVAKGDSYIRGLPNSNDIKAAMTALSDLGIKVEQASPGEFRVGGQGGFFPRSAGDVRIGSSGTVARFLPGLMSAAEYGAWRLTSSDQLARRPLQPLVQALNLMGADCRPVHPNLSFPMRVKAVGLPGGETQVSAKASSQFASGVLMAAPLCLKPTVVRITHLDPQETYVDMTLDMLRRFGIETSAETKSDILVVRVPAPQVYQPVDCAIAADANSAMYFLALPVLVGGTGVVENLSPTCGQPGLKFLEVLERLGGVVETAPNQVRVTGRGLPLTGGFEIDMRAMSEMALTLGAMAPFADAPITMTNLYHIRGHETDRLEVLAKLLRAVGVEHQMGNDSIRICPADPASLRRTTVDSHDDHRVAMSFTLLGLAGNGLGIANAGTVAKTFPDFFTYLDGCGAHIEIGN